MLYSFTRFHKVLFLGGASALLSLWMLPLAPQTPDLGTFPVAHARNEMEVLESGKSVGGARFSSIYRKVEIDELPLPVLDKNTAQALRAQLSFLRKQRKEFNAQDGSLFCTSPMLHSLSEALAYYENAYPHSLLADLEAYQIAGSDRQGHVYFTGYYAPLIRASRTRTKKYKYPLYRRPKNWEGALPSREMIDGTEQILQAKGLEIAYTADRLDNYFLQLQGSGHLIFQDGAVVQLAYDGANQHAYRSVARTLIEERRLPKGHSITEDGLRSFFSKNPQLIDSVLFSNPSYTFFSEKRQPVCGAAQSPLMATVSVAVDPKYIPLGSILLAAVPRLDAQGHFKGHTYRLLIAQDVGGQMKGPGHIDLYMGEGAPAKAMAQQLHHYGKVWLLLPKEQT